MSEHVLDGLHEHHHWTTLPSREFASPLPPVEPETAEVDEPVADWSSSSEPRE